MAEGFSVPCILPWRLIRGEPEHIPALAKSQAIERARSRRNFRPKIETRGPMISRHVTLISRPAPIPQSAIQ